MTDAKLVRETLGCTAECAEAIAKDMHQWICPDYSESSWAELRRDFRFAAKCMLIKIVKDPSITPKKDYQ